MKNILSLFIFLFFSISFLNAQEVCDDGVDNDGDGFIDCFDSDCSGSSACAGHYLGNADVSCQADLSSFSDFSLALGYQSASTVVHSQNRIAIGDLDRDRIPEILSSNKDQNKIFILNGNDASIKYEATTYQPSSTSASMVNLQNDGCGEVFIINQESGTRFRISSFDCELNQLWTSEIIPQDPISLGFADFDRDGKAEMYYKDEIRDPITGTRIVTTSGINWDDLPGGAVAVDILGDEYLELVLGNKIYAVNLCNGTQGSGSLTLLATMPAGYRTKIGSYASGLSATTSIADYNLDGNLDVIVTGTNPGNVTSVFLWDVANHTVKTFNDPFGTDNYQFGWIRGMGRVNVGDMDGDGLLNATFVSGKYLYALDENFELLWRITINEESSGITSPTLFDFNGDGITEVVYRDEDYLYIINGNDGTINTSVHCRSRTMLENPIVADVNADGSAEICVVCTSEDYRVGTRGRDLDLDAPAEVRVYKSAGTPWVGARSVWNQHAYFNVNINDDLTVPRNQQKHQFVFSDGVCTLGPNRPLNGFMNQSPILNSNGCPSYAASDLNIIQSTFSVTAPSCPDEDFVISFDFENIGSNSLSGNVPITFYDGDPLLAGSVKLNTEPISLTNLGVGDVKSVVNLKVEGLGTEFTLYAVLNDNGSTTPAPISLPNTEFLECDYTNNIISKDIKPIPFTLSTEVTNSIMCSNGSVASNGSARAFSVVGETEITANYDFLWFNGETIDNTPDFTGPVYEGLSAGIYTVFATDKLVGCSSDTIQVTIVDNIITMDADITVDNGNSNCLIPNGKLTVSANEGEPVNNYTYEWYEGNTIGGGLQIGNSHIANALSSGTYTVLVTDKSTGCQTIASAEVPDETINPDATIADAGIDIETCVANVMLGANAAGANETGTWSITISPEGIATPANFDDENSETAIFNITDLSVSGDYIIRWTITDDQNNCSETYEEITVTYEATPNAGIFNAAPSVRLTVETSPFDLFSLLNDEDKGGNWSLTFSDNNNGQVPNLEVGTGIVDLSAATTGNYEFTYTVEGALECAVDSETVTIYFKAKEDQTITFDPAAILYQDQFPYTLEANSSSELPVQFEVTSGSAAISGNQLIFTDASTVVVEAFQAGNDTLNPAEVEKTIAVLGNYDISANIVRPDDTPLEEGLAKLFNLEGEVYSSQKFTEGSLTFRNIRTGEYILQIIPLGDKTSDVSPTYYTNAYFNNEATIINLSSDLSLNIFMKIKTATSIEIGSGQINGKVVKAEEPSNTRISLEKINEGEGVGELIVYLIDQGTDNILRTAVTDDLGSFRMSEIPGGNYQLLLDIPGIEHSATSFSLPYDEQNLEMDLIIYLNAEGVVNVEISTILGNDKSDFPFDIFPNPTKGVVHINGYAGPEQKLSILSANGGIVKTVILSSQSKQHIDLSDLNEGIYYLLSESGKQSMIKIVKN